MAVDPQSLPTKLAQAWPPSKWAEVTVLVAVSGGPDSVALLRAMAALKTSGPGKLLVAHYNHRWRQAESDADEQFVRDLADQLGLQVLVERAPARPELAQPASTATAAPVTGGPATVIPASSVRATAAPATTALVSGVPATVPTVPRPTSEESAREARYAFFSRAAHQVGARYVALAHTADDQVETVLHHLFRGTGLAGLAGMPRARPLDEATALVRPLLDVWRAEVLAYLEACGQPYREDRTNVQLEFRRNWLRHKLLPQVEQQYGPHVRQAILQLAFIARQTDDYLAQQAEDWLQTASRTVPEGVELHISPDVPPPVLHAAVSLLWKRQGWPLQDFSFEKWSQLIAVVRDARRKSPTSWDLPGGVHADWAAPVLRLTRLSGMHR
jgi:tRNA(Ile)-lysidine synthase